MGMRLLYVQPMNMASNEESSVSEPIPSEFVEGSGEGSGGQKKGNLLASGILGVLTPAVTQVDKKVEEVR